jgi:phage-related protein
MKNLINGIEELKKTYNQVSAFATDVSEFSSQIQNEISGAVSEMSAYTKNIMGGVRGYTITKLSDSVKQVAPNLFPTQIPKLYKKVEEGTSLINCAFNKITANMPGLLEGLLNNLLDKMVNTPLCAVENFVAGILDNVLGQLMGVLDQVFASINSVLGTITGALGGGLGGIGGNMFNALEYVNGIKSFFKCDDPATPVKYNEVAYGYPALPGGDAAPTPTAENESPTGQGAVSSQAPSGNIVNNTGDQNDLNQPTTDTFREAVKSGDDKTTGFTLQ